MARKLTFEQLENRRLLAAVPELLVGTEILENGYGQGISETGYFSRYDRLTGQELWRTNGTVAGTYLVKDINPLGNSGPSGFFELNGEVFFHADDGVHGRELWKTDGTALGTVLVKDIREGPIGTEFRDGFTKLNDTLLFAADDGVHRRQPWVTDGTEDGTLLLRDFSDYDSFFTPIVVGDIALFDPRDGLWKTDGTVEGTKKIDDIDGFLQTREGVALSFQDHLGGWWFSNGSERSVTRLTSVGLDRLPLGIVVNDVLYYYWDGGLWRTDGSPAGPSRIERTDSGPNPIVPTETTRWVVLGNDLCFAADDGELGSELWKVNGSLGTFELVRDINVGAVGSEISQLVASRGLLFFVAEDGVHRGELWRSDGTAAGTSLVEDITPGNVATAFGALAPSTSRDLVYFFANRGDDGLAVNDWWLWRSDGTSAGTFQVSTAADHDGRIEKLTNIAGGVVFIGTDAAGNRRLFRSDGTAAGTLSLSDNKGGWRSWQASFSEGNRLAINGTLFFSATLSDAAGRETETLMKSDGTPSGTTRVRDFANGIGGFQELNGNLVFRHVNEVWISDGSEAGTSRLLELTLNYPAIEVSGPYAYVLANDYFGDYSMDLWRTDGTVEGTTLVKSFNPGRQTGLGPSTVHNGLLYFGADDGIHGRQLWRSDGTEAGTILLSNVNPNGVSLAGIVGQLKDKVLFHAYVEDKVQLWGTDGTVQGTALVVDQSVSPVATIRDTLFFLFDDGTHGRELWKTDGKPGNKELIKDINTFGSSGSEIDFIGILGDSLIFSAFDGYSGDNVHGVELWKSDGTAEGTVLIKDLNPGIGNSFNGSSSTSATVWNGEMYFVTTDRSSSGEGEVWRTDGTEEGTIRITDPSFVQVWGPAAELTVVGDTLYFFGEVNDIDYLFSSDGTREGTAPVLPVPGLTSLTSDGTSAFMLSRNAMLWAWENQSTIVQVPGGGGTVRVSMEGNRLVIRHDDAILLESTLREIGQLNIRGSGDHEAFFFDIDTLQLLRGLRIEGGPASAHEHDAIHLVGSAIESSRYVLSGESAGTIEVGNLVIQFEGIEEFIDELAVSTRRFTFPRTDDDITLGGGGDAIDDRARIDVGNTEIKFINPTAALLIDAGDGDDTVSFLAPDRRLHATIEVARAYRDAAHDSAKLKSGWRDVRQVNALGNYFLESAFGDVRTLIPIQQSVWHNPTSAHSQWHNPLLPADVNGDGIVAALDVLLVFNLLNDHVQLVTVVGDESTPMLVDTNGDRYLSPIDALIIINEMNSHFAPTGEGEEGPLVGDIASITRESGKMLHFRRVVPFESLKPILPREYHRTVQDRIATDTRIRDLVFGNRHLAFNPSLGPVVVDLMDTQSHREMSGSAPQLVVITSTSAS